MDLFWNTWELISMIEQSTDQSSIQISIINIANAFGFSSVFGGIVPPIKMRDSQTEINARGAVQHLPSDWAARYLDQNYLRRDPIVHRLQNDRGLFTWSESYASSDRPRDARLIGGEAAEFGLTDGLVVPVSTLDLPIAALSFGGARDCLGADDRSALAFISHFAIGHWLGLRRPKSKISGQLTPREFDCLLWAGDGKTDWEISVILGISRSTVVKHIASAREKLGAMNKTHAVATAMRMKILG
jgi:LuxR family quorum sensing-dependent transcriptional regulator